MGSRGPVPKRSDQRRRVNKDGGVVERVVVSGSVEPPDPPECASVLSGELWDALAGSGQATFFEASDWWLARLMVVAVDDYVSGRKSATKLAEIRALATELLMSEGSRRRLRLELDRGSEDVDEERAVAAVADIRERFAG